MNPLLIPLIIATVGLIALTIGWALSATQASNARGLARGLERDLYLEEKKSASWRDEARLLRRQLQDARSKPQPAAPKTPLQGKLDNMVNAVTRPRTNPSPIRHAKNIQPSRRYDDTDEQRFSLEDNNTLLNAAIMGAVLSETTVTNHLDTAPEPEAPKQEVISSWNDNSSSSSSYDSGSSGSYDSGSSSSSDSGSFSGGDSGSF